MIRKLCYRHHVIEFSALPNGRHWEASAWITVNEDYCEMCHPELLEAGLEIEEMDDDDEKTP